MYTTGLYYNGTKYNWGKVTPPQTVRTFEYTGTQEHLTLDGTKMWKIECWGAGSNTAAGGYASGILTTDLNKVNVTIIVGQSGSSTSGTTFGFGGSSNYGSDRAGGGLSGVFFQKKTITASDADATLVIAGGAGGGTSGRAGGMGGGETGQSGQGSSYGTAGGGGTQTGRGSGGNAGAAQFNGGNGSGAYGWGGGGGWWGGNGSIGDSGGDDDKGAGGGSGHVISQVSGASIYITDAVLTQGGGSAQGQHGKVVITMLGPKPEPEPITTPGVYHNAGLGLISLSSNGTNWITIADKNLGATTVYNNGDTLSETNCGKYYQWGNNYGFPWTGSVTTSSTQVDASSYGPGNYYSSSTFIAVSVGERSSVRNDNLWGGVTGTNEAMQGPCSSGYHVPTISERETVDGIGRILGLNDWDNDHGDGVKPYLKMPFAGERGYSSSVESQGTRALYWSSTVYGASYARHLRADSSGLSSNTSGFRSSGKSIRPFKNEPVQPDTSRTKLN